MVKKISKISLFVLTQSTNVTDTQTDRQTPHDDIIISRLWIASRGKHKVTNTAKPTLAT